MKRGILIALLATGAVAGFTLGIARLWGYGHWHGYGRGHFGRDSHHFEEHVADVCTRAAERVWSDRDKVAPAPVAPK